MARRGKKFVTTRPDPTAARPPDRVRRDFTAVAPNRLWVVDYTYVPTWSGMAFTAFVCEVFSRRIVGWRTAASMPTSLPLDALEMALWTRQREGHTEGGRLDGLVHHSDAGSQTGLNRWLQHQPVGVTGGVITLRYNSKLRHIGLGREHSRKRVLALIADRYIRVVDLQTGELLRDLTLDPTRDYQPLGRPPGPRPTTA